MEFFAETIRRLVNDMDFAIPDTLDVDAVVAIFFILLWFLHVVFHGEQLLPECSRNDHEQNLTDEDDLSFSEDESEDGIWTEDDLSFSEDESEDGIWTSQVSEAPDDDVKDDLIPDESEDGIWTSSDYESCCQDTNPKVEQKGWNGQPPAIESKNDSKGDASIPSQVSEAPDDDVKDDSIPLKCVSGCFPQLCETKGRCKLCQHNLVECNDFSSLANEKTWSITNRYSCRTKNVVYLVTCSKHEVQYVGSAKDISRRWSTHKRTIHKLHRQRLKQANASNLKKVARVCGLARHFYEVQHDDHEDPIDCLRVQIIDHVEDEEDAKETDNSLKIRETIWMEETGLLMSSRGLNMQKGLKRYEVKDLSNRLVKN